MPSRPLIVRLRNWIGDVVLGVPALHLLQRHGFDLHLVARGGWAPALMAGHPWTVAVQPDGLRPRVAQLRDLRARCAQEDPGFNQRENALSLPHSFSSALELRLAGLKAVGYNQEGRRLLLARAEPITYGGHALTSYWALACRFLRIDEPAPAAIRLAVAPEQQAAARAELAAQGVHGRYIVICPFAGGTFEKLDKTWPDFPAFTRVAKALGLPLVVYPGPKELDAARRDHADAVVLPSANVGTYKALLAGAALVISNDTGPAHIAAAVGTPVLSVLGPTKPEQWAPWGPQVQVLRHWPRWPTVAEVMAAAEARLAAAA